MTTPSGSSGSTGPVSVSHPSTTGHSTPKKKRKTARKTTRRKVRTSTPSSSASVKTPKTDVSTGSTKATDTKDVTARKTTPATGATATPADSTPAPPPSTVPPQPKSELDVHFEEAVERQKKFMKDFWFYDQVNLTREMASSAPEQADALANKLQIVIKIQMPGTNEVIQLIPRPTDNTRLGEAHEAAAFAFLKQKCEALYQKLLNTTPPRELYDQYVWARSKVLDAGEKRASPKGEIFDYEKEVYINIITSAFEKTAIEDGVEFKFSRGNPDPSKYKDPGDLNNLPPAKPKNKKKKKKSADKAKVEFRIAADKDSLKAHEAKARARSRSKSSGSDDSADSTHKSAGSLPSSSASDGELSSSNEGDDSI